MIKPEVYAALRCIGRGIGTRRLPCENFWDGKIWFNYRFPETAGYYHSMHTYLVRVCRERKGRKFEAARRAPPQEGISGWALALILRIWIGLVQACGALYPGRN